MKHSTKVFSVKQSARLLALGLCTGFSVGVFVTFFNLAAEIITEFSQELYAGIQHRPAFVPLLFLVLVLSAFGIAVLIKFVPMVKGCGIPQTEAAARGLVKLKWYEILPALTAASLYCMFLGVNAGTECPSMLLGATIGDGASQLFASSSMERRYHLTNGACAGLAVASNAPLTGIIFALEEAHRRFTPSIFVGAFASVFSAVLTRNLLYAGLNMPVTSAFTSFTFSYMPPLNYLYVALAALASGLVGVAFYKLSMLLRRLFKRMNALGGTLRLAIPLLFAGVAGLITAYAVGGGHSLIEALGTNGGAHSAAIKGIFGSPVVATLIVVLALRFVAICLNVGSDMPVGVFVPMIAIGALIGALLSKLCMLMGMDAAYCDQLVVVAMATFFAATVKAPLTAIVMSVEFTWQFALLLPTVLGVAIGYFLGYIFKTQPIYEAIMEDMVGEGHNSKRRLFTTTLVEGSAADGRTIRNILWPDNMHVLGVERDGTAILPSSDAVLHGGDKLSVEVLSDGDERQIAESLDEIVKPFRHTYRKSERMPYPSDTTLVGGESIAYTASLVEGENDKIADDLRTSENERANDANAKCAFTITAVRNADDISDDIGANLADDNQFADNQNADDGKNCGGDNTDNQAKKTPSNDKNNA